MEKTLEALFHRTLKDIYYAEREVLKGLQKMSRNASSPDLETAFSAHREETAGQIERLQKIFELLGKRAQGKTCDAMEGLLAEGDEVIENFKDQPALDAGLVATAQAIEHYEIARYGTLKAWADELGMTDASELLGQTLKEEIAADALLSTLAGRRINHAAIAAE